MLPQIYSADDYYSYSFAEEGNAIVLKARLARDRQKVTGILAALNRPASGIRAIDIGAGDGSLLEAFRAVGAKGENLYGAELAQHAVDRLNARGFRGLLTRAEEMDFSPDSFDVVTMIQVIEHVANPNKLVHHLGGMMSKGGILFLETPNMKSWDRRFFRKQTWGGYHFPRHWTLWDPDTMTAMLNDSGFDVVSITTPPSAVIWVWSVNHVMQAWFGNGRIARFFSMNNPFALALFWLLELLPSKLGWSANMRIIARRR
jgi:2-polyprenyl-3-methyl-5-hydroxy-6-metoxy-1,4-benzoquinol methylase